MDFILHPQLEQDCLTLGDFTLCRVLLVNEQQFPWLILVPKQNDIQETYQLSHSDQQQLQMESSFVGQLLMTQYEGDKLNIGAIGNMVPQLHIHHIVRFKADTVWPKPVWGNITPTPYTPTALTQVSQELTSLLEHSNDNFKAT